MPTEQEVVGVDDHSKRLLKLIGVLLLILVGMIASMVFYVIPQRNEEFNLRVQMHSDYCKTRGWQTYTTRWERSCVDKDGSAKVIPDSFWKPLDG